MPVDPWMLTILITVNIAVLTAFGGVLWAAYRSTTGLRVSLHGENGDAGFIERTTEAHEDLAADQHRLRLQLRLHGQMWNEAVLTIGEIATVLEHETDAEVAIDRLDDLHDRVDTRWQDNRSDDD